MIHNALYTLLSQRSPTGTRVAPSTSPIKIAAGEPPRLLFTHLGGPRDQSDDGPVGPKPGRIQLDIFADDVAAAHAIADRLMRRHNASPAGLDGYRGTVDSTVIESITFPELPRDGQQGVLLKSEGANVAVRRLILPMTVVYRD